MLPQPGPKRRLKATDRSAVKRNRMDSIASAPEMAFRTQKGPKPVYSVLNCLYRLYASLRYL